MDHTDQAPRHPFRWWLATVALLGFGIAGCAPQGPAPETVLEDYLEFVYQGKIVEAQALCTPAGKQHLEALRGVIFSSESSPDTNQIEIISLVCEVEADTAFCTTRIDDGYAKINGQYALLRTDEGWQVDQRPLDGQVRRRMERAEEE
ncbi:MAG: hypothetical protein KDC54_17340 [Lewinella sp.]|nr:hypothetical protein [Lewinella sp.]